MIRPRSRIALVVPYFGKLPNYFQLWLISCKYNPTIDWYLFTDDRAVFDYPQNVHVTYWSFKQTKQMFQNFFDFDLAMKDPYKLCDFKPTYGEIFGEYLSDYDFWGCCDVDLVFGDIRKFITEEILTKHDKILSLAHFALYRNSDRVNAAYRDRINGDLPYKKAFSDRRYRGFDERGASTIQAIFEYHGMTVYDEIVYADIRIDKYHFELTHSQIDSGEREKECTVFAFQQGRLVRYYCVKGKMFENEYLYLHLQKRPMKLELSRANPDKFLIVPNRFIDFDDSPGVETLKILGRRRPVFLRNAWRVYKDKAKGTLRSWIRGMFQT
jgi:hypothetical protein